MKNHRSLSWYIGFSLWYVKTYFGEVWEDLSTSLLLDDLKKGRFRIWYYKRKLGKAYLSYLSSIQRYSCGAHLHEVISPRTRSWVRRLDEIYAKLEKLDPDNIPPKTWGRR